MGQKPHILLKYKNKAYKTKIEKQRGGRNGRKNRKNKTIQKIVIHTSSSNNSSISTNPTTGSL